MDTPLAELKGRRVRELMPFTATDDGRIRYAASCLLTGQDAPVDLPPRHCVSVARLAVTRAAQEGKDVPKALEAINRRTMEMVRRNAPPGLRAANDPKLYRQHITADDVLDFST
jgi:hypothetical protein